MANLKYKIGVDLGELSSIASIVNKEVFPLLNQAVRAVTQQTAINWQHAVNTNPKLWAGERQKYMDSIQWTMTGDFSGKVVATYKYAEQIETGRPARDLKKMLDTSTKVRRTESGKRFLVIPLRHNIKKLQAAGLYDVAAGLAASNVSGTEERMSGEVTKLSPSKGMSPSSKQSSYLLNPKTKSAVTVNRNIYNWGQRMTGEQAGKNKWAKGMVRMDTSTPEGSKSSAYLTFRIMMEGQKGWIVPAVPGQYIAKQIGEYMQPLAEKVMKAAVKKQIE